jgi:hypothetical protein
MRQQRETFLKTDDEARMDQALASFFEAKKFDQELEAGFRAEYPGVEIPPLPRTTNSSYLTQTAASVDVPFTIGKRR